MRILLLHLGGADAEAMAESLRADGHHVDLASERTATAPSPNPPQILVVCLEREPQRTLDLAARIGDAAAVPAPSILFVGGSPAALGEAQRRFPKASFARIDALSTSIASMEV